MEMRCSDQPTGQAQLSNFISPFLHAHQALFAASAGRAKHEPSLTWPCLRFNNKCVCGATHLSAHACKEPSGARTESVALAVFPGESHLTWASVGSNGRTTRARLSRPVPLQSGQHCCNRGNTVQCPCCLRKRRCVRSLAPFLSIPREDSPRCGPRKTPHVGAHFFLTLGIASACFARGSVNLQLAGPHRLALTPRLAGGGAS